MTDTLFSIEIEFYLEEGTIITDDLEANEERNGKSIRFLPLWKWLFEGQFSV